MKKNIIIGLMLLLPINVESSIWGDIKHVGSSIGHAITHPAQTAKAIGNGVVSAAKSTAHAVTHPAQTAKAIGNGVTKAAKTVWKGTKAYFTACKKYEKLQKQVTSAQATLTTKQTDLANEQDKYHHEQSQYEKVEKQYKTLKKQVTTEKANAQKAQQALATARNNVFNKFKAADVWLKGRVGKIINKSTTVSLKLVYSNAGTPTDYPEIIAPGQTKYVKIPFKTSVASGKKVANVMVLIPYVNGQQSTKSHAEAELVGRMYGIAFNVQSMNKPGHPYGYAGSLCVSRMYPSVATRAHSVQISSNSLISDTDYWEADITVDEISGGYVYPRISTIRTQSESYNANADLPTIDTVAITQTSTAITQTNSSATQSYPSWSTPTGAKLWSDLPV